MFRLLTIFALCLQFSVLAQAARKEIIVKKKDTQIYQFLKYVDYTKMHIGIGYNGSPGLFIASPAHPNKVDKGYLPAKGAKMVPAIGYYFKDTKQLSGGKYLERDITKYDDSLKIGENQYTCTEDLLHDVAKIDMKKINPKALAAVEAAGGSAAEKLNALMAGFRTFDVNNKNGIMVWGYCKSDLSEMGKFDVAGQFVTSGGGSDDLKLVWKDDADFKAGKPADTVIIRRFEFHRIDQDIHNHQILTDLYHEAGLLQTNVAPHRPGGQEPVRNGATPQQPTSGGVTNGALMTCVPKGNNSKIGPQIDETGKGSFQDVVQIDVFGDYDKARDTAANVELVFTLANGTEMSTDGFRTLDLFTEKKQGDVTKIELYENGKFGTMVFKATASRASGFLKNPEFWDTSGGKGIGGNSGWTSSDCQFDN